MTKRSLGRTRNANIQEINRNILKMHPQPEQWDSEWMSPNVTNDLNWESAQTSVIRRMSCATPIIESAKMESAIPQTFTSSGMSSASSWTDDGYEQEATEKVQEFFDAIDCLLYENKELPDELKELHSECDYWRMHYPHLRINGVKLVTNEIELFESALTSPAIMPKRDTFKQVNEDVLLDTNLPDDDQLCLMVKGISLKPEIIDFRNENSWNDSDTLHGAVDEIIEQDGEYEELIAIDRSEEDLFSTKFSSHSDRNCHRREIILDRLTKNIWKEVVSSLRPLLTSYISFVLKGYQQPDDKSDEVRANYLTSELPLTQHPTMHMLTEGVTDLQSLLTISSKTLQDRNTEKFRPGPQTSAPAVIAGTRLISASPPKLVSRSTRGRLAPLGRSAKISPINTSSQQERLKTSSFPVPPISPHSWGKHFPLPPIDCGPQVLPTSAFSVLNKEKSSVVPLRMLSAASNKRGFVRDQNKSRFNVHSYPLSTKLPNLRSDRLYSAQLDCVRNYPVSYAAVGRSLRSGSKLNAENRSTSGFARRRMGTACVGTCGHTYESQELQTRDRLSTADCFQRNLDKRSTR